MDATVQPQNAELSAMETITTDVLIVGAGPTGLTLACLLARHGIAVQIIEKMPSPPTGSRGKGLQPRSLEVFDDIGIVSDVISSGRFDMPLRQYDENGKFTEDRLYAKREPRPDTPYPGLLLIPQFRVEESLRNKLSAFGRTVSFGSELLQFEQDDDGVLAKVRGFEGDTQIRCHYLIGCDGGRSTVRHQAGIPFAGETIEAYRMLLGDVRIEGLDRDHWHIWRAETGFFALCPLPSTDLFQLQGSVGPLQDDEVSLSAMQRQCDERTGGMKVRILEADWMSLWRANVRMVDRYRVKNVFLAGDAARVHSPAGGQGMNTGIQDAYNLGWKLASALRGGDPELLDSYQKERLPVAADVLGLSTEMMNKVAETRTLVVRRDDRTKQLALNYRHSSLSMDKRPEGLGLRAGDRAPDAPGLGGPDGTHRMFDLLRGPNWTLIGMGSRWRHLVAAVTADGRAGAKGYVIGEGMDFVDREGHARTVYGDDLLYIIRPDNYIGLVSEDADVEAVENYLRQCGALQVNTA